VRGVGYTDNALLLATAYRAADLFVLPALADNMPNGVLESMACGTPGEETALNESASKRPTASSHT